ncbi:FadR/GntR family transcriptional regulator [Leucobacter chinensis]|uniref:FadR/GntR family transcriptional regulator n=1 Tax=Leucobacter chinensis TaxID=2851010 RepID=UPI001C236026
MPTVHFPALDDARHRSVADIVQHVVQSTVELDMQPGDKFPPERRLGELLGVGRSPLREALKCLDILGFIEIRQGDGTYLASDPGAMLSQAVSWGLLLGSRQADELIESRHYLEVALAELAASRRSSDELGQLAGYLAQMEYAGSTEAFTKADTEFHFTVARAARNEPLASMLVGIKSLLSVWVTRVVDSEVSRETLCEQHRAIFEAIKEGDPNAAAEAMSAHISAVTGFLKDTLE